MPDRVGGVAANLVIGCVAENDERFLAGALRLLQSLRWFGGSLENAAFILSVVEDCSPDDRSRFEALGATVRIVSRFSPGNPYSNKLRFYEQPDLSRYQCSLLLDCDTIIVRDPTPWLTPDTLRAKVADLPTVPSRVLASVCRHFGIPEPPAAYRTTFNAEPTIWYCNSGVVLLPVEWIPGFVPIWRAFVLKLLEQPQLLGAHRHHCNQAALALAYLSTGVRFEEFPLEMNFPLHLFESERASDLAQVDPVVLHYHRRVNPRGYLLPSLHPLAQRRIRQFNHRLRDERHDDQWVDEEASIDAARTRDQV